MKMAGRVSLGAAIGIWAVLAAGVYAPPLAAEAEARAILWRDPGEVGSKDLFWGSGSADRAPKPPFKFVKEDLSGTKPKVHVVDAQGTAWSVKFDRRSVQRGREVPAEIAASRLMWALGYLVEESYLVRDGVIEGIGALERADSVIGADGHFKAARFERRPTEIDRLSKEWRVDDNPFVGSRELSGLVLVAALLNNWDLRAGNTGVLRVTIGDAQEDWYLLTDVGTAFGGMGDGSSVHRSKWTLKDYQMETAFIAKVDETSLELYLRPDDGERARVPIEHARWLASLASGLTEQQVRRAFQAAGASDGEVRGFTRRFLEKTRELKRAVGAAQASSSRGQR